MRAKALKIVESKNLFFLPWFVIMIGIVLFMVGRDFPMVGHDYRIHIPRMLDTHLHHLINGIAI